MMGQKSTGICSCRGAVSKNNYLRMTRATKRKHEFAMYSFAALARVEVARKIMSLCFDKHVNFIN